jgi:pimeloyl-ACP methyl ester carboxylesterase
MTGGCPPESARRLVVRGSDNDVLSKAQALRMVDALPHAELVRVAGIGHAPTLVEPVVLAALDRFLGGLQ